MNLLHARSFSRWAILALLLLSFASASLSARTIGINVRAKGNGSVTLTINGQTQSFGFFMNPSTTTWELGHPVFYTIDDEVEYVATVSSSNVTDYVVFLDTNPNLGTLDYRESRGFAYRETHELVMDEAVIDGISKSAISGGMFTVRSANKIGAPFGEMDSSNFHLSRSIRFGLDNRGVRGSGGHVLLTLSSIQITTLPKAQFVDGSQSGLLFENASRLQAYSDAGFVDVIKSGMNFTVRYYKPQHGPANPQSLNLSAPYAFDAANKINEYVALISQVNVANKYQPPYIENSHPPATMGWAGGHDYTITKTVGGVARVLEFTTDYYHGMYYHEEDAIEYFWEDSITRVWPWRQSGADKGGLTEHYASTWGMTYFYPHLYRTERYYVTLNTSKHAGDAASSALLESERPSFPYSGPGIQAAPVMRHRGVGADEHALPTKRMTQSGLATGYLEQNGLGGETTSELYRGSTVSFPDNLDGEPVASIGKMKYSRRSFLDGTTGASTAIVTDYKYQGVLSDTQILPVSEVATQSGVIVSKATTAYLEFAFGGQQAIQATRTDYASASATVTTVAKSYAEKVSNPDLRGQAISVTRPDGSKTSYGIQRGNWTTTGWSASSTGTHLRRVSVNGKSGATVSAFPAAGGMLLDPIGLEAVSAGGWLIGRNTAEEKIFDARSNVVFEGTYTYTAEGFKLVSHKCHDYNDLGYLTKTYERVGGSPAGSLSRVLHDAAYSGHLKTSDTDVQGVKTLYAYDVYDRLITSTVEASGGQGALVTQFQYDGIGRVTKKIVGAGTDAITVQYTYDTAGRVKTVTDEASVVTQFDYNAAANTTTKTESPSDGAYTETTAVFKDGRTKSVSGTAVPDRSYAYLHLSDGRLQVTETFTAGKWTASVANWLGQTDHVREPTFAGGSRYAYNFYNSAGQLHKQEFKNAGGTHLSPRRLLQYDTYGRLEYEGLDTDMDGVLDRDTDANVRRRYFHIQKSTGSGGIWELYEAEIDYPYEAGGVNADHYLSQTYTQLGDFAATALQRVKTYDSFANESVATLEVDRPNRKLTKRTTMTGATVDAQEVNHNGRLASETDFHGNTFTYEHDSANRIVKSFDPRLGASYPTRYFYKPNSSQLDRIENPDGTKVAYTYNAQNGRMTWETFKPSDSNLPDLHTRYAYDAPGNVIRIFGNAQNPVWYSYNDLGQRVEMRTYRSGTWSDYQGVPAAFDTLPGDKTTWSYHAATGLLQSKRDAANKGSNFAYDDLNRVATRTDARGVIASYAYYDYSFYTQKKFTGMLYTVTYNTAAASYVTATPTVTYSYKRDLSLHQVIDAANTRTFGYFDNYAGGYFAKDSSMLPKYETLGAFYYNKQIDYDYQYSDPAELSGVRHSLQLDGANGYRVLTAYDEGNRLTSVAPAHQASVPFEYGYAANSSLVQSVDRDGSVSGVAYRYHRQYAYEANSHRLDRVRTDWNGGSVTDVMPRYDAYGRHFYTETLGNVATGLPGYGSYGAMQVQTYTERNEVDASIKHQVTTPSVYPNDNGVYGAIVAKNSTENGYRNYDYDPIGNRALEDEHDSGSAGSQTPIATNSLNQYTQYRGLSLTYDANGNLTYDGARDYVYDAENNLTEVIPRVPATGDLKYQNKYDYLNRRSLKRVWEWTGAWTLRQDLTSRLVYDGWNLIAEITDGGTIKKKYTWGSDVSGTAQGAGGVGGLLMIELKQDSSYVQLYPIYDSQHNVIGLHDSSGTIVARYDYDAFGETFNVNGAAFAYNQDTNYAEANPFRYSTKYTDNFSASYAGGDAYRDGLVYYGLRFYHPEMGRFVNRDPIEESGGLNLYGFVGNSPTNGYDNLGMWPEWLTNLFGGGSSSDSDEDLDLVELDPIESMTIEETRASGAWDGRENGNKYDAVSAYEQERSLRDVAGTGADMLVPGWEAAGYAIDNFNNGNYLSAAIWTVNGTGEWVLAALTAGQGNRALQAQRAAAAAKNVPAKLRFCFPAGTMVVMADGSEKAIEEVKEGDEVIAWDFESGEMVARVVTTTFSRFTKNLYQLTLDGENTIETTGAHPFWVQEKGWTIVANLEAGMKLFGFDGVEKVVTSITQKQGLVAVYNFEVLGDHNYFAGGDPVLVHNQNAADVFTDFNNANNKAIEWLKSQGVDTSNPTGVYEGKLGPNKGKPVGMNFEGGRYRIEWDPKKGAHINVEAGKLKGPHFRFEGNQKTVNKLISRLFDC